MNCIFVTHTGYIYLFYQLEKSLREHISLEKVGYYVSGRKTYDEFLSRLSTDWAQERKVACEWDILENALNSSAMDYRALAEVEAEFGDPTLWNTLVCDRRLYYGRKTVFTQDYKPRFAHEEMLKIATTGLQVVRDHVESVKPDFIISFINVTFGEYFYYLVAKRFGIPFLNFRNTKVENFVTAAPDIFASPENVKQFYLDYDNQTVPAEVRGFSRDFISRFKKERVTYEGQTYLSPVAKASSSAIARLAKKSRSFMEFTINSTMMLKNYKDNQLPDPVSAALYSRLFIPIRYKRVKKKFSSRFVSEQELSGVDFAFFPLHIEPEIALLTYSRPYLNQIEVVRWLSLAIPSGWKLVVKDHPKKPHYRSLGYYKKLFEIPNVVMVSPHISTFDLIRQAKMVLTISGFVGFEALCQGKPAIALGHTAFEFLPDNMYRRVADPREIASELADLMKNHSQDEEALERYVDSVVCEGVRFDWYSIGRHLRTSRSRGNGKLELESRHQRQFDDLALYIRRRLDAFGLVR
jgi:hypothetical protein